MLRVTQKINTNLMIKRYLHDRKLPQVINTNVSNKTKLIGTQSPKKADYSKTTKTKNKSCSSKWQNLKKYGWFIN